MITDQQQRELYFITVDVLEKFLTKARNIWGREFPFPRISFDLRGRTAGYAYYSENKIRLNGELFLRNQEEFIKDTIPHELAHLISYQLYGREGRGHGANWKTTIIRLGVPAIRCHQMETTPARKTRKFRYTCNCRKFVIGAVRHKRLQAGRRYTCRSCKSALVFLSQCE